MRSTFLLLLAGCFQVPCAAAHIGSPDVFYEGMAGPYRLFVTVRTPPMIPGIAQIEVRALDGNVTEIQIAPLRLMGEGSENAPPPDRMEKPSADPQFFTGKLWLMASGSWQVRMDVFGAQGKGEMAVPVPAAARRTLFMPKTTGTLLAALMTFLVVSMVAIFGAAVRESGVEPGAAPSSSLKRRGRIAMVVTAAALVAILFLGNMWWNAAASGRATLMMYKAPPIEASLQNGSTLILKMGFSSWHDNRKQMLLDKIIPDHGHMMHLFLLSVPDLNRFYHLHPAQVEKSVFSQQLPTMPSGDYVAFADIVRESGFPDTMTTRLALPNVRSGAPTGDDSQALLSDGPLSAPAEKSVAALPDGNRLQFAQAGQTLHSLSPVLLRFQLFDSNGRPASDLEPYLGMAGHLVIVKRDLSVFAHVHPAGSVPMAALMLVAGTDHGDGNLHRADMHQAEMHSEITFPYGFPQPGEYRLFVQSKRNGQVETGVFDVHVEP